jgi:hypothetical protein
MGKGIPLSGNACSKSAMKFSKIMEPARLTIFQTTPQEDSNHLLARVRKALAYCRKATGLARGSKSQSKYHEDIGLGTINCSSSTSSHRQTCERRPTILGGRREESVATHNEDSESSYFNNSDPFITSPSWLREDDGEH